MSKERALELVGGKIKVVVDVCDFPEHVEVCGITPAGESVTYIVHNTGTVHRK